MTQRRQMTVDEGKWRLVKINENVWRWMKASGGSRNSVLFFVFCFLQCNFNQELSVRQKVHRHWDTKRLLLETAQNTTSRLVYAWIRRHIAHVHMYTCTQTWLRPRWIDLTGFQGPLFACTRVRQPHCLFENSWYVTFPETKFC